jgi:hypothetical protein
MFGHSTGPTPVRPPRLLGQAASFSATGTSSTVAPNGTETITEVAYAVREGRVRMEMDLTKTRTLRRGKPVRKSQDETESLVSMGMDKQVTLVLPEKSATYLIYPGMKSYCLAPQSAAATNESNAVWKDLGADTIDGHPCTKHLVTTTQPDGTTEESTVWKATDLNNFIIQTVSVANGETTTWKFANVKLVAPDASLFELPADYKQYGSMQDMMMGAMQKMMQNMGQ